MTTLTKPRAVALIAVGALIISGCGSSSKSNGSSSSPASSTSSTASSSSASSSKSPTIKVGLSPTISSVNVAYAEQAGLFKKAGLNVTTTINTSSGAATFPELLNGQLQMTIVDPVSPILAIDKGLKLTIAAPGNVMPSDPSKNYTGIMVKKGSGITSPAGLDGKTIAVNSLDSILSLMAQVTIDSAGGHSSTVKFVEVPPLSEVDSVAKGQTNALINVEPLLAAGEADGLTILAHPPASVGGLAQDFLVTSSAFASANPTAVKKFAAVIEQANATLAAHPSLIIKTAVASGELKSAAAAKGVILPTFASGGVSASALTKLMSLMVKYKILSAPVSISKLLPNQ